MSLNNAFCMAKSEAEYEAQREYEAQQQVQRQRIDNRAPASAPSFFSNLFPSFCCSDEQQTADEDKVGAKKKKPAKPPAKYGFIPVKK